MKTSFIIQPTCFSPDKQEEREFLDSMVAGIRLTGDPMEKQMPKSDQIVEGGMFDGKNYLMLWRQRL